MVRTSKEITALFSISCIFSVLMAFCFPSIKIHFFVPPLIVAFYAFSEEAVIWRAFYIGCFLDILYFSPKIGFYPIAYTVSAFLLLRLKKFFFQDDPKIIALLTYLFSCTLTVIEAILMYCLEGSSPLFSIRWLFFDCLIMPCIDALYAVVLTVSWRKISFNQVRR